MSERYLIGVDMGTSLTKVGIFDAEGNVVGKASRENELIKPGPGRVEQKFEDIYSSAIYCISKSVKESGIDASKVEGIACSSQMSGIGAIDEDWNPVMHFDNWLDTRCEPYIEKMNEEAGDRVTEKSGCPPTYSHGPKILWWKNERPKVYDKIYKFIVPYVYVAGKMAGLSGEEAYIDPTCLHFSNLSDTENSRWSDELLSEFEVDGDKMPRIIEPDTIIGELREDVAEKLGLVEGIPISAGAGDQPANALGAGVVDPGTSFDVSGTASVFSICVSEFEPDVSHKVVMSTRSIIEDTYYALAFINGGGMNLKWFRDEIAEDIKEKAENPYQKLDEMAEKSSPGSDRLFFIPHVQGRVLPPNPSLRGLWFGFTWNHTRGDLYRSILESISYEYAYYRQIEDALVSSLEFEEVRTIGGGSKSQVWNQMKADILGIPYVKISREELGVFGDALLAGYSNGIYEDLADTSKSFTEVTERIEPRKQHHEFYKPYVDFYSTLLENMGRFYSELAELPSEAPEKM
ncbi:MAG: xylulokinase [Candidatus Hadarchaeia archaeon]